MALQTHLDALVRQLNCFLESQQKQVFSEIDINQTPDDPFSRIIHRFKLNASEQLILLLAAGQELRPDLPELFSKIQNTEAKTALTFSLILGVFTEFDWAAITPASPLRRWQLIEIQSANTALLNQPIRIHEHILFSMLGIAYTEPRVDAFLNHISIPCFTLPKTWQSMTEQIQDLWQHFEGFPAILLTGKKICLPAMLASLCQNWHFVLVKLNFAAITDYKLFWQELRTIGCHARLHGLALYVDLDEGAKEISAHQLINQMQLDCPVPLFFASREPLAAQKAGLFHFHAPEPKTEDQQEIWQAYLGKDYANHAKAVRKIAEQFSLEPEQIATIAHQIQAVQNEKSPELWELSRQACRQSLQNLAQRIESKTNWDDLMLPDATTQQLEYLLAHIRHKTRVYQDWGFKSKTHYGFGINALFYGSSGTGKTMAASAIANTLELDLYRIDLSQTINKYIGETEKHLSKIFDMAESSGALLLFDEADALFGKRSDVSDSKDRYANMQVSYLLQRLETYTGIAILTTNFKEALDHAFVRRLRFMIEFPYPNKTERKRIWQACFPKQTPLANLDFNKLAQLHITGSNIKNIALHAAFIAAESDKAIDMVSIKRAVAMEYKKLEKVLTEAELAGWD